MVAENILSFAMMEVEERCPTFTHSKCKYALKGYYAKTNEGNCQRESNSLLYMIGMDLVQEHFCILYSS